MIKEKTVFKCNNCGFISNKWLGQCPSCLRWNSFIESNEYNNTGQIDNKRNSVRLFKLSQIDRKRDERIRTNIQEWDRVTGGGIVRGSFSIITGDPGIGKSTLLLQIAEKISSYHKIYYFSSEESLQQLKDRTLRLNIESNDNLLFSDKSDLESIIATCQKEKPDLLILDSIQNCKIESKDGNYYGSVAQLREIGFRLFELSKKNNIAVIVTGHITKEGYMAGPKLLEHIVDAVFYLQAEDKWQIRILRSVKNRFGTLDETGFFTMSSKGLIPLQNINKIILQDINNNPGSALISSIEGSRAILLELQALVVQSKFGISQRVITGIDSKKVILIAAILEKYLRIKFSLQDIYFKVSGGLKIKSVTSDLGIAVALLSSYFQKSLPEKSIFIAEISLTGQIKPVNHIDIQIKEAEKFGLRSVFLAASQKVKSRMQVNYYKNIFELLNLFPK